MKRWFFAAGLLALWSLPVTAQHFSQSDPNVTDAQEQRLQELRCTLGQMRRRLPTPPAAFAPVALLIDIPGRGAPGAIALRRAEPMREPDSLRRISNAARVLGDASFPVAEDSAKLRRLHHWTLLLDRQLVAIGKKLRIPAAISRRSSQSSTVFTSVQQVEMSVSSAVDQLAHTLLAGQGVADAAFRNGASDNSDPSAGWRMTLTQTETDLLEDTACLRSAWNGGAQGSIHMATRAASLPTQVQNEDEWRAVLKAYLASMEAVRLELPWFVEAEPMRFMRSSDGVATAQRLIAHLDFIIATLQMVDAAIDRRLGAPPAASVPPISVDGTSFGTDLHELTGELIRGFHRLVDHHLQAR